MTVCLRCWEFIGNIDVEIQELGELFPPSFQTINIFFFYSSLQILKSANANTGVIALMLQSIVKIKKMRFLTIAKIAKWKEFNYK